MLALLFVFSFDNEETQLAVIKREPPRLRRASFFAEPAARLTHINRQTIGLFGLKLGVLIKERWQLGVAAHGHANRFDERYDGRPDFALVYGGASLEYAAISFRWFRLTAGAMVGGGAYGMLVPNGYEIATFFAVEPILSAEFRPARWLGLGLQGGYRFTAASRSAALQRREIDGWFAGAHLRFGL